MATIFSTISALCDVAAGAHAEAVDERSAARAAATATLLSRNGRCDKLDEIARKGDRDRGHAARLDRPAAATSRRGRRAAGPRRRADRHIGRQPRAVARRARRRRGRRSSAMIPPMTQTPTIRSGRIDVSGDLGRVDEDSRADDAAHDEHGGVEEAKPPCEAEGFDLRGRFAQAADASMTSRIE